MRTPRQFLYQNSQIRAGEPADIYEVYREMNDRLVTVFAHGGLIDAATAAALGHQHGTETPDEH